MHACLHKTAAYREQLFPVVPYSSSRGGCGLMADTDWALRGGGEHKQSPLWQFPDVSQQSTWLADDSPGRCGHFLDSSTLFLHRPCKQVRRRQKQAEQLHMRLCNSGKGIHQLSYSTITKTWPTHERHLISQKQFCIYRIIVLNQLHVWTHVTESTPYIVFMGRIFVWVRICFEKTIIKELSFVPPITNHLFSFMWLKEQYGCENWKQPEIF